MATNSSEIYADFGGKKLKTYSVSVRNILATASVEQNGLGKHLLPGSWPPMKNFLRT